jgi:hypothetical protein
VVPTDLHERGKLISVSFKSSSSLSIKVEEIVSDTNDIKDRRTNKLF